MRAKPHKRFVRSSVSYRNMQISQNPFCFVVTKQVLYGKLFDLRKRRYGSCVL